MRLFGYGMLSGGDHGCGPTRMDVARPGPAPKTKSGTGNAALDGYTVTARRVRGDTPGDMVPVEQADRIESAYNDGPLNDY